MSYKDRVEAAGITSDSDETTVSVPLGANFPAFHVGKDFAALNILWGSQTQTFGAMPRPAAHDSDYAGIPWNSTQTQNITRSMLDSLTLWGNMDPSTLAAFQAALYNKGFFGKDRKWANYGNPDDASFNAWKKALTQAAKYNKSIWEILGTKNQEDFMAGARDSYKNAISAAASAIQGGGSRRAPLQIRYSNPDDLKAVASKAAQDALGYVPDSDFLDQFVKIYHGVEGSAQRKAYSGGNYTEPGDPGVQADKLARKKFARDAEAHDVAQQFQNLLGVMGVTQ